MFAIKYFFLHHHHHKYPSMYAHRILRLIALLLPFLAGRASASSEEERPKVKHAERLLSKLDSDGELLLRASDATREAVLGARTLLPEATENFRDRILQWARKPTVAKILRNPPSASQGLTFERLSRRVNQKLEEKLREHDE